MNIDLTLTLSTIIETTVMLGGGLFALSKISSKIETKIAILHTDFNGVKDDIVDMKSEIKKVNEILVRMNAADLRIGRAEQDIRDLRRGHGFVQGPSGVDREY